MKKVGIFKSDLLRYSETFIRDQACALRNWHPVLVGNRRIPNGLALNGLEVRLLPGGGAGILPTIGRSLLDRLALPNPLSVTALREMGLRLVHAHFGTDAVDIWPVVKALGLPMLVTLHGYDINTRREWWEAGHGGLRRYDYPRRLLVMAHHPRVRFIAVSQAIRKQAVAFGIPEDKITVHYIGVDTDRFRPGVRPIYQRPKRILFVGRLIEKKGAAYLIRAYAALRRRVPDAELVIAGDGPLRAELERLAADLRAPIQFLGALPHKDVTRQMEQTRVFCLPSVTAANGDAEGLPIVILEAQACGLPVITSACGGAGEAIVDAVTGYGFPEKDIERLSDLLLSLLLNANLISSMSESARQHVMRRFTLDRCTGLLEVIYEDVAQTEH